MPVMIREAPQQVLNSIYDATQLGHPEKKTVPKSKFHKIQALLSPFNKVIGLKDRSFLRTVAFTFLES